jgi:hypothetical protein
MIFSIKTDFNVLQLLNGLRSSQRLFCIGYTLPKNQSEAIFRLSQVQNFLGFEGCDGGGGGEIALSKRGHIPLDVSF